MNSADLTAEYGFGNWLEVGPYILSRTPDIPGFRAPTRPVVYAMRLVHGEEPCMIPRLSSQSDLLRIGRNGQFGTEQRQRLRNYRKNHQPPNRRTRKAMLYVYDEMGCCVEVGWLEVSGKDKAVLLESQLLDKYYSEHKELPPWNRSG